MSKEKKTQRGGGSDRSSSRGASKRPTSPSGKTSQRKTSSPARKSRARKKEDRNTQKRRKTEQAVRKASARTSGKDSSTRRTSSTQRDSSARRGSSPQRSKTTQRTQTAQRDASPRRGSSAQRDSSPQRRRTSSAHPSQRPSTRGTSARGTSTRNKGASVRGTQGKKNVCRTQPAKKRKLTAAEIARRKMRRTLLLIVVGLLVFLVLALLTLNYVSGRIQDQSAITPDDDSKSFAPVACTADMVDSSMRVDAPAEGDSPITFTITLRNTSSEHPCYIDVGRENISLDITSGDQPIVDLSTCESAGKEYKQLLIDRDMTTSFTVTWNRHSGRECSAKAPVALPGTYHVVWTTKGQSALEAKDVFEIKPPPEPEPAKSSEGDDGKAADKPAEQPTEQNSATAQPAQ